MHTNENIIGKIVRVKRKGVGRVLNVGTDRNGEWIEVLIGGCRRSIIITTKQISETL